MNISFMDICETATTIILIIMEFVFLLFICIISDHYFYQHVIGTNLHYCLHKRDENLISNIEKEKKVHPKNCTKFCRMDTTTSHNTIRCPEMVQLTLDAIN